jgi:hypothetical protein
LRRFKYNPIALKSALLPSLSEDDQLITRSKKRQRIGTNGISTDPNAPECDSEYGVVLETLKERFLVVRHGKNSQSASADEANGVPSDKPKFTISLIQGEVEVAEGLSTSTTAPTTKLEDFTPVPEEPKSPLPALEQPTKEPSPVEPLPPVSTPQEVKQVARDSERGRSASVVDMELDTPVSVTPTATAGPDIPVPGKILSSGGEPELGQDPVQQGTKPTAYGDKPQPEDKSLPMGIVSAKVEVVPLKPPSAPASITGSETTHVSVLPTTSAPVPRPEAQGSPQVQLKLQILQRNILGDDLVFGNDGLGVLSADVDPLDNAKKGWLIEAPRWRRYNGRISDCIVVD